MTRAAIIATAIAMAAAPALAEKKNKDAEAREQAKMLFRAGERAFDTGKYKMAAGAFERAYEVLPLPAIAFSAAQAYRLEYFRVRQNPLLKRAVQLYRIYIDTQKSGGRIKDAVTNLAELEPMLERAEREAGGVADMVRVERTALVISSPIKGATGSVNGGEPKSTPFDLTVEPGRYTVVIGAPGYAEWRREVDVVAGQTRAVEGELVALKMKLAIDTDEGAEIRVDGERVGTAPLRAPLELDAGDHFVAVTSRGHVPYARRITGERGATVELDAELPTTRQRKVAWALIGTGGAFVIASAVAGLVAGGAQSRADELDRLRRTEGLSAAQLAEYQNKRDERDQARTAAFGALFVGVAVGGAGALFYFLDHESPAEPARVETKGGDDEKAAFGVAPVVSADRAGVALTGRF